MWLIVWFKNLKWIRAIRDYDGLVNSVNVGLKLQRECDRLKEENDQVRQVFHAHRTAAIQSIVEAHKAEQEYKRKLLDDKNSNRPSF